MREVARPLFFGAEMSGQHTPGPWVYGVRDDGSIWLSLGDFRTGPHFQGDLVASEDDARLICAAPDLLAIARRYASECAECGGGVTRDLRIGVEFRATRTCPECAEIREAIAKATT
jgi:hypothetical protein